MSLVHALTFDVEDYFQVLNLREVVDRGDWHRTPLRCVDSTRRILDLLERHDTKATFSSGADRAKTTALARREAA